MDVNPGESPRLTKPTTRTVPMVSEPRNTGSAETFLSCCAWTPQAGENEDVRQAGRQPRRLNQSAHTSYRVFMAVAQVSRQISLLTPFQIRDRLAVDQPFVSAKRFQGMADRVPKFQDSPAISFTLVFRHHLCLNFTGPFHNCATAALSSAKICSMCCSKYSKRLVGDYPY